VIIEFQATFCGSCFYVMKNDMTLYSLMWSYQSVAYRGR